MSPGVPPEIDWKRLHSYRLNRIKTELSKAEVCLALLVNPVSLQYAIDLREYMLFQSHIPHFYAFIPLEGPVILHGSMAIGQKNVDEIRPWRGISFFNAGPNLTKQAEQLATDINTFLDEIGSDNRRVACEYVNPSITKILIDKGIDVIDAVDILEKARCIKSAEEIECIKWSIRVAEHAMYRMHQALHPGITENQLWSVLHQSNITHNGEWIDGRMLASGQRTNPWLQEAQNKMIAKGELVAFDTDMIGPNGYCADISRTFYCGDGSPSAQQKSLYRRAWEEVHHNLSLIRPGLRFKDLSESGFRQPECMIANRYPCLAHGVGMCDEYPKIYYRQDWDRYGYDGVIEENMVLCIESYVGEVGGNKG